MARLAQETEGEGVMDIKSTLKWAWGTTPNKSTMVSVNFFELHELQSKLQASEEAREKAERERDESKTVLDAWQDVFGSTQLTHASDNMKALKERAEKAERERDTVIEKIFEKASSATGVPSDDGMSDYENIFMHIDVLCEWIGYYDRAFKDKQDLPFILAGLEEENEELKSKLSEALAIIEKKDEAFRKLRTFNSYISSQSELFFKTVDEAISLTPSNGAEILGKRDAHTAEGGI